MIIQLTDEHWANVRQEQEIPVRVSDPALLRAEVYERLKSLFEDDPVTNQERQFHLQQFGRRAGWDDPQMDVYDNLDPRDAAGRCMY